MNILVLLRASHAPPPSTEALPWLGPCDEAALSTALALATPDDTLIAVTAGPAADDVCLEAALRAGAPRAVRFWDRSIDLGDLRTLCGLLAGGIVALGFDLVLTGQRSADWGSGAVGPALAHFLGVPHVSSVAGVEISDAWLRVQHLREDEIISLSVQLPALLAVVAGPPRGAAERSEHPAIELLNLEDTTLRLARAVDAAAAEPLGTTGERPTLLTGSGALLLAIKNAGVGR